MKPLAREHLKLSITHSNHDLGSKVEPGAFLDGKAHVPRLSQSWRLFFTGS